MQLPTSYDSTGTVDYPAMPAKELYLPPTRSTGVQTDKFSNFKDISPSELEDQPSFGKRVIGAVQTAVIKTGRGVGKAVNFAGRKYQEVTEKHPVLCGTLKKTCKIVFAVLMMILQPISGSIGFVLGVLFKDQLKAMADKTKGWFNKAGFLGKAGMIAGGVAAFVVIPQVRGLLGGAMVGTEVRNLIDRFACHKKPKITA